jgi:hypothetical protein
MPTGFWNSAQSEPRRAHRFLLSIPNLTSDTSRGAYQQYLCKTVTKPAYTIGEVEHKFLGNTYYYPGAVTWDPVTVTLVNAVDPDGNEILFNALYKSGHLDPHQQSKIFNGDTVNQGAANVLAQSGASIGPGTLNKADSLAAFGNVLIKELGSSGESIGTWELRNPFVTNVKFGDLDYASEELLNLEMTFRYDFALYYTDDSSAGTPDRSARGLTQARSS